MGLIDVDSSDSRPLWTASPVLEGEYLVLLWYQSLTHCTGTINEIEAIRVEHGLPPQGIAYDLACGSGRTLDHHLVYCMLCVSVLVC